MHRRRYLATAAITLGLTGCSGDGGNDGEGNNQDTMTPADAESPTPTDTSEETDTPTETEPETETETETPTADVSLSVGQAELVDVDLGYYTGSAGQVAVENTGNAPSNSLRCTFDWFDDNGEYLASDANLCRTIAPGEVWVARFTPTSVDDPASVGDVEAAISGGDKPATIEAPDVELVDSQLRASEDEVLVRGEAQNNSDTELGYLEAIAKVYDGDDRLLATEYTNETNVSGGATWRFEMNPFTVGRNGDVESAEVLLTTSTLS